jgi:cell division protein FtsB
MLFDLDTLLQTVDGIAITQEQITRNVDQLTARQKQITREIAKLQGVEQ